MFTCFDLIITEEETDSAILDGHYILQAYATTHWLDHVKEGTRGNMSSADFVILCQKIWMFLAKRTNQNFNRKSAKEERVLELKLFEKDQKHIYRELCYINSSLASELSQSLKPSKETSEFFHPCAQPGKVSVEVCKSTLYRRFQTAEAFCIYYHPVEKPLLVGLGAHNLHDLRKEPQRKNPVFLVALLFPRLGCVNPRRSLPDSI